MTRSETVIHLSPHLFTEKEKPFIEAGPLSASVFHFATGVCGLRLKNELGQVVLLPYQGQQIWSAEFGGRILTMKSAPHAPPNACVCGKAFRRSSSVPSATASSSKKWDATQPATLC